MEVGARDVQGLPLLAKPAPRQSYSFMAGKPAPSNLKPPGHAKGTSELTTKLGEKGLMAGRSLSPILQSWGHSSSFQKMHSINWGYLVKAKVLVLINARRVLEGGWYLNRWYQLKLLYTWSITFLSWVLAGLEILSIAKAFDTIKVHKVKFATVVMFKWVLYYQLHCWMEVGTLHQLGSPGILLLRQALRQSTTPITNNNHNPAVILFTIL